MYPISLDLSKIRITLVGKGEPYIRRLKQLQAAGAVHLTTFEETLPQAHEIRQATILMVAGLDDETSAVLTSIAKLQGILVNVEDKPDLCDFHFVSFVQRGDLTLSVSTNGASPTLSREIKNYLAELFGEEWSAIVDTIGKKRLEWKKLGLDNQTIGDKTRDLIRLNALLKAKENKTKQPSPESLVNDALIAALHANIEAAL